MQIDKLIAAWLPIALGVVMIGAGAVNFVGLGSVRDSFARWGYPAGFHRVTGGLEVTAGLLLLIPATSRAGAIGSVAILLAAVMTVMTLIRHRDWTHLPGAVVLTAVAVAVTIRG
jgi:membrane protein HdeD